MKVEYKVKRYNPESDDTAESKKQSINKVKETFLENLLSSPKSIQSATE